jgi:heptosyltransferase I
MPKRVLIVRLSAVGDTILSMPIACALRRHLPHTLVGWVVARGASELLQGHPCLDRLFVMPPEAMQSPIALGRFVRTLREWKPDVVIDAQGLTKSALLGWLSGAGQRVGLSLSEFEGRELSTWLNNLIVQPTTTHVIDRGLELLRPLGIPAPKVEFQVPEFPTVRPRVWSQLEPLGMREPWAMINVGAGWVSKIWPNDRYAAVARHLADRWNMQSVIVWGGEKERLAAEEVVSMSDGAAILAPPTSLQELAEWIRCTHLFVGSDTGPMHLAAALDIPTIGLIGPMPIERVGPRGPKNVAIQRLRLDEKDRGQRKSRCEPMLSIDVPSVLHACDRILGDQGSDCGSHRAVA